MCGGPGKERLNCKPVLVLLALHAARGVSGGFWDSANCPVWRATQPCVPWMFRQYGTSMRLVPLEMALGMLITSVLFWEALDHKP